MRIKLHINKQYGDYDYYPIYDIDYEHISTLTGFTMDYTSDTVGSENYKYRQFHISNNLVAQYILGDVPINETSEGNIIPFWHRYNNIVSSRYTMPQDVLESFAAIEQGVQPDDWATNPNYVKLERETVLSHDILRPQCIRLGTAFEPSSSYYEDTKRTQLRMFYTDTNTSFTVSKSSFYNYNRWSPRTYTCGSFPSYYSGTQSYPHYAFTSPESSVYNGHYHIDVPVGITASASADYSWTNWESGYNCPMYFIHFVHSGIDFYGVALVQMDDFTETATPVALVVTAWDSTFFGSSIISGGEPGVGKWGNYAEPTIADGTFSEYSENLSPSSLTDPYTVTNSISNIEGKISQTLVTRGVFAIFEVATTSDLGNSSALKEIYSVLYDPDFLHNYFQSLYNPLSAVLSSHLIPTEFITKYSPSAQRELTISGYPVSDKISDKYPQLYPTPPKFDLVKPIAKYSFDPINIEKYTDSFADFSPYTKFILHLPFIGKTEINANYLAHGSLQVEYACDIMSGNVIAYIWAKDDNGNSQYILSASGNCAYNVPMYSYSQDGSAVGKIISSAIQFGSGVLSSAPSYMLKGATGIISGAIGSMLSTKSTEIQGTLGGNNTLISSKQLWLEIIRPKWIENCHYQLLKGIPAEMSNCIADCAQDPKHPSGVPYSGYLQISHIELDNVNCTDSERSEIEALLKTGVYIRGEELLS